ncbi:PucR family transcriptional regulator [Arthrobacter sp. I2-34]|uniref:PucR family transcriptional regulator n=1 Tax=Arthrobacter hankyongi TaxID=2904801 RepID=A0ABS9L9N4_9MICC|nr:PucR family transcriptional regulator [Arthrobacter hankyongi]MCG2623293.1 PucR family transcriptional regulator [Arthrobacter hankyongi]
MMTVGEVLDLPVLAAGAPEILAGRDKLQNPVRWVHVAELTNLAGLLGGGELVLSTGLGFGGHAEAARRYLADLEAMGAAGVVVELAGDGNREPARAALREAAAGAGLPVVMLRRQIRFVEVTEVVHRQIVAAQLAEVERARHVHEVFTMLSLEGAGAEEIVSQAAGLIEAPVVLEDAAHLVVAFAAGRLPAAELLRDWEARSRLVHFREETTRSGIEGWLQTPVGLRGQRWGRLVVPAALAGGPEREAAVSMVLERAGQALSINRMAERDQRELTLQARAGLLQELRRPRSLGEPEALARAAALGLRPAPLYLPVVLRLDRAGQEPIELQRRERALLELVHRVLTASRNSALSASLQSGSVALLLAVPARQLEDPVLERICGQLADEAGTGALRLTAGVGRARQTLLAAAAGLDEAAHVAETASTLKPGGRRFYRSTDVRLRGLLALLSQDPRVQAFVEAELAGVLRADGGWLPLLERYLECGGNKAELARTGFLSRPTLYARLTELERRLGVRLDDPESRTSLHVAVLLHRLSHEKNGE